MRWTFEHADSDDYVLKCDAIEVGFFSYHEDAFLLDQGAVSIHELPRAIEIEGIARWMVDALNAYTVPFDTSLLLEARNRGVL